MILAWMLYALVIAALLGCAALLLERAARSMHLPARHIWLVAIISGAIWPFAVIILHPFHAASGASGTNIFPMSAAIESVSLAATQSASPALLAWLSTAVLVAWVASSAVLLVRLVRAGQNMQTLRRSWRESKIDGHSVLLASGWGPAVVGTTDTEIVVPEWALSFDTSLRELILRHENEHRRAHDPLFLQMARVVGALLPWNVALQWQLRRIRAAIEVDCDARVLRAHPDPDRYSKLLLAIAHFRSTAACTPAVALVEDSSQLEGRIIAMQNVFSRRRIPRAALSAAAAVFVFALACDVNEPVRPQQAASSSAGGREAGNPRGRELPMPGTADQPFFAYEVSKIARFLSGPAPDYPSILKATRQTGKVIVSFVVDTTGSIDMRTFEEMEASNALFTKSVKMVLPKYRFSPAEIKLRKVAMFVQMPFEFGLQR